VYVHAIPAVRQFQHKGIGEVAGKLERGCGRSKIQSYAVRGDTPVGHGRVSPETHEVEEVESQQAFVVKGAGIDRVKRRRVEIGVSLELPGGPMIGRFDHSHPLGVRGLKTRRECQSNAKKQPSGNDERHVISLR